jgi:hypothetical protein
MKGREMPIDVTKVSVYGEESRVMMQTFFNTRQRIGVCIDCYQFSIGAKALKNGRSVASASCRTVDYRVVGSNRKISYDML